MPGDDARPDLSRLMEQVEEHLLGGARKYTRVEVAERSGLAMDEVRSLWRALGFATVEDDDRVFTDADIEALRNVEKLKAIGGIDTDVMHAMTRIIGQTFARLASWQGQVVVDIVAGSPQLLSDDGADDGAAGADDGAGVTRLVDRITPVTSALHDHVWRRQLAAYLSRAVSNAGTSLGAESPTAVGFADMAGFTAFTRQSSEAHLRGVLGTFETLATEIVGANGGQIVKTIGDEVLFAADDPRDAAEIALSLVEAAEDDESLPQLRAGVGFGDVVKRLGDVYGQTVNIASRLTSIARPGSVLVDQGLFDALEGDERYVLHPLRPVSVRGYHHLRSWRLRRS